MLGDVGSSAGEGAIAHRALGRRDVLRMCGVLGLGLPFAGCASTASPNPNDASGTGFDGKVFVIGAGAAGMSAGLLLAQRGVDFEILEAAPTHGGRIKSAQGFVDFPIPLGGEWLHEDRDELARMVNNDDVEVATEVVAYDDSATGGYFDGSLEVGEWNDSDLKFVGATWLDFFDEYIVPVVEDRMTFGVEITAIDYSGERIGLASAAGEQFVADRVIITVPLRALQDGRVAFTPRLPEKNQIALREAQAWPGFKAFIEFDTAFYPTFLSFPDSDTAQGQRLYYDAAYGQNTDANVLGLFSVGEQSKPYSALEGAALRDYILAELDEVFDGAASRSYIQHIEQDWSTEPFIEQAYISDHSPSWIVRDLWTPIEDRLFFAGEAYTRHGDWGAVDDAARAARDAVAFMLQAVENG